MSHHNAVLENSIRDSLHQRRPVLRSRNLSRRNADAHSYGRVQRSEENHV